MDILHRFKDIISTVENPIVFEFGMCDGYHSNILLKHLSNLNRSFVYHGFEPVKELFDEIVLHHKNGDVHKFNMAIGNSEGIVPFYKSGGQLIVNNVVKDNYYGSSSIRKPHLVTQAWPSMTFEERTVEITSFDRHLAKHNIEGVIDFIWADIQGAEIDLIKGGKEAFKKTRYFYTEFNNSQMYEGLIGPDEICNLLNYFEIVEKYKGDILLKNKLC